MKALHQVRGCNFQGPQGRGRGGGWTQERLGERGSATQLWRVSDRRESGPRIASVYTFQEKQKLQILM